MKTRDLTGLALDRAVAKCLGETFIPETTYNGIGYSCAPTLYSVDWELAGPIIEQEKIGLEIHPSGEMWMARPFNSSYLAVWGKTPLIAAMRCFVVIKLGDEIDLPE